MKVHVEVTQEDIDNGVRGLADSCMVALAFNRATEGAFGQVYVSRSGIITDGLDLRVKAPAWVGKRISYWDWGRWVNGWVDGEARLTNVPAKTRPFAFDLDLPDEASA